MPIPIPKPLLIVVQSLIDACDRLDEQMVKHDSIVAARERLEVAQLSKEIQRLMPIHGARDRLAVCQSQLLDLMSKNDRTAGGADAIQAAVSKLQVAQQVVQTAYVQYCGCPLEELQRTMKDKLERGE